MKRMQRSFVIGGLLLIAAGTLLLSALYPGLLERKPKETGKTIQLILRTSEGEYWKSVASGAQAAVEEFGVTMHIIAPGSQGDIEGQVYKAMLALEEKPDAIVLGANDDAAFAPFLQEAAKQRIPVIAIDSLLMSGETASYVGMDNYAAGKEAVRQMSKLIGGEGKIAIVSSTTGGITGKLREQGIFDAIMAYSGFEITDRKQCPDDYSACQKTVSDMLDSGEVDGILSLNTETSTGAAMELKRRQTGGQIKLIGFDSSTELLELLQEDQLQALIVQNPFSIGYLGVKYAIEATEGLKVPERVEMDMKLIDKNNMFWRENQKLLFPIVQ